MRRGTLASKWCTGCGKFEFHCHCRNPVLYCDPVIVSVWIEEMMKAKETAGFGPRRVER